MKNSKLEIKKKPQKNVYLKNHTTFKIGGQAKYFFEAQTKKEIIEAVNWAKKKKIPFFILGGGSNLLVADKGFGGLVIKIKNSKLKIQNYNSKFKIIVTAGFPLAKLVLKTLEISATGLEWAVGIPGTIGGAIYGNAGAFGKSMADIVREVEVFDVKDGEIKLFKNRSCRFNYRESIFKKNKNLIIFGAKIQLKKTNKKRIQKKIKEYLDYRKKTQPLKFFSAGSIFKNPKGFSAGELIEKANLKGKKIGSAQISEKHTNFIVNLGRAKAKDVLRLIKIAKQKIKKKFGINFEEEIEYLGWG